MPKLEEKFDPNAGTPRLDGKSLIISLSEKINGCYDDHNLGLHSLLNCWMGFMEDAMFHVLQTL